MQAGILFHGNALLGLLAAALWGMGDFSGGMAVRRAGSTVNAALRVVLMSHAASFCVLLSIALLRGDPSPHGTALAAGLLAGFTGGVSLIAFYMALATGAMGASAAISGLLAAAIPAAFAMAAEGLPGWQRGAGFLIAGLAIWLIAGGNSEPNRKPNRTLPLAILAGAGFGCYFVALKYAGAAGLVWPMAAARIGSMSTCLLILLGLSLRRPRQRPPQDETLQVNVTSAVIAWALSTALLDTSGNLLFLAATRAGRLDVAAVLASLYPATTILLAAILLKEKPSRQQALGMAIAIVAVVLITL
jgi:drug/metabolite transporter (DMT)-like permease